MGFGHGVLSYVSWVPAGKLPAERGAQRAPGGQNWHLWPRRISARSWNRFCPTPQSVLYSPPALTPQGGHLTMRQFVDGHARTTLAALVPAILCLAAVLAACASGEPTATPTPGRTPGIIVVTLTPTPSTAMPTQVPPTSPPVSTPAATGTIVQPTDTPIPPPPSATPEAYPVEPTATSTSEAYPPPSS